jgi:integrase
MAALTWKNVDFDHNVVVLQHHKTRRTQRTPRPRIIQLVPRIARLLRRIKRQEAAGKEHVFLNMQSRPWNRTSLGLRTRRLRDRAGVPNDATLYCIRHQFGTQSIINGVDIKTLSELMGHTSTQMTEHYCHLAGHQAHLATAMLQAVYGRRMP